MGRSNAKFLLRPVRQFVSDFCPWQHLFQICGQFCGEEIPITMVADGCLEFHAEGNTRQIVIIETKESKKNKFLLDISILSLHSV